ncbi:hypothetical protein [Bradyrhizobium sp.]|uniref:hypothetical protein n=1 Tax=Bradyrhizobium sp. TaxID=376 RepID=UPI0039E3AC45
MLATLNSKQIVDEIVKDTVKDNDPHDAVQISPEIVLASRAGADTPTLAPEIASRPEPRISVIEAPVTASSVDTAVRAAASDVHGRRQRSPLGKLLRGAFVTMLFAGGGVAATFAWEKHGDTAKQTLAELMPAVTSLLPSTSQTTPVAAAQAAPQAAADATTAQPATAAAPAAPPPQDVATASPATAPDATQSLQSMTQDLAAMAQQIEQLKANIAELKAGQEQMAREMAKPPAPRAEARPVDPRARVSALPPRPPVRKPKPTASQAYVPSYPPAQTYAPPPIAAAPQTSQTVAVPPPAAVTSQAVADDDGPVVRPPMPVR